jgi:hypothetical protein
MVHRVFSFDVASKDGSAAAAAFSAAASSTGVIVSPVAGGGAAEPQLSIEQIQLRLRYKLGELREVWRILRDPVRRCQYDERRDALGLAALTGNAQNNDVADHPDEALARRQRARMPPGLGLPFRATARNAGSIAQLSSMSHAELAAQVDLDAVLRNAEQNALRLPAPTPAPPLPAPQFATAPPTGDPANEPLYVKEQLEEKYPVPSDGADGPAGAMSASIQSPPAVAGDIAAAGKVSAPSSTEQGAFSVHLLEEHFSPGPQPKGKAAQVLLGRNDKDGGGAAGADGAPRANSHGSRFESLSASAAAAALAAVSRSARSSPALSPAISPSPPPRLAAGSSPPSHASAAASASPSPSPPPKAPPMQYLRTTSVSSLAKKATTGGLGGSNVANGGSSSSNALPDEPWMPGDLFSLEWNPFWGYATRSAAPSNNPSRKNSGATLPAAAASAAAGASSPTAASAIPAATQKVKLELMVRKGSGWLSRVTLVQLLHPGAPDSGRFSFHLPVHLPPRKGYFVRMTLLPAESPASGSGNSGTSNGSSGKPFGPIVTESPMFEVVALQKAEKYMSSRSTVEEQRESQQAHQNAAHKHAMQERMEEEKKQANGLLDTPLSPTSTNSPSPPIVRIHE